MKHGPLDIMYLACFMLLHTSSSYRRTVSSLLCGVIRFVVVQFEGV